MNNHYYYPAELISLLKDAIPRINKTKKELLIFFRSAGVPGSILSYYENQLQNNREEFKKFPVAQDVLVEINRKESDFFLAVRREIVKRVVEFEDYSSCYHNDQLAVRGLLAQIRQLVDRKDSFTRMKMEREAERSESQKTKLSETKQRKKKSEEVENLKKKFYQLFEGDKTPQARGKLLENVLNDLFKCYGISVKEAFTVKGINGEGIVEQIDGVVEFGSHSYLVEMKWLNSPVGVSEISQALCRLFSRGGIARGLFISYSNYTDPAITTCRDAVPAGKMLVLSTLQEIVALLENNVDFSSWLKDKVDALVLHKNPHFIPEHASLGA